MLHLSYPTIFLESVSGPCDRVAGQEANIVWNTARRRNTKRVNEPCCHCIFFEGIQLLFVLFASTQLLYCSFLFPAPFPLLPGSPVESS